MRRLSVALIFAIALSCSMAYAQQPAPATTPGAQPVPQAGTAVDPRTGAVEDASAQDGTQGGGAVEPPADAFGVPMRSTLSIDASATLGYRYDDNVFSISTPSSDHVGTASLRFSATKSSPRLVYQLHYLPTGMMYAQFDGRNGLNHVVTQDVLYRWSRRTEIRWTFNAARQPGLSPYPFSYAFSGGTMVQVFEPSVVQNRAMITIGGTNLEWSHRLSRRATLKISAGGGLVAFKSLDGEPLIDSDARRTLSATGSVSYMYQLDTRQSVGVEVNHNYFAYFKPNVHTQTDEILARYSRRLPRGFTVSLGVGPSIQHVQPFFSPTGTAGTRVGYALDASVARATASGIYVDFYRGTHVAHTQRAMTTYAVGGGYQWRFGRRWVATTGMNWSRAQSVGDTGSAINGWSTIGGIGYLIRPGIGIGTTYYHYAQRSPSTSLSDTFDRNTLAIELSYNLGTLFGRRR